MRIVVALVTGSAGMAAAAATLFAANVHADPVPPDPNVPNMGANYCPGGREDGPYIHRCVGSKYPDGSYWRESQYSGVRYSPDNVYGPGLRCVIDFGSVTIAAPPGGCNGAV